MGHLFEKVKENSRNQTTVTENHNFLNIDKFIWRYSGTFTHILLIVFSDRGFK